MNKAPLSGIKVLDLSRILAGPWASQCLADFGAEVWKIEKPGVGDDTRSWGPPWFGDASNPASRESAYYLSCNRGKRSLAIDITIPAGQDLIHQLAQKADVLLENFKVGGLAKYRLDYASLQALNPRLIYCSITGFGQTGPKRDLPGYDAMIQAQGGIMSITGEAAQSSAVGHDSGPQKIGVAAADLMTGMYAVSAVLAALHARHSTGFGQHIDLALFDTQLAWLANQAMNYLVSGEVPKRLGTAHPNIVPYQVFATRDGHLMLAVGNDRQFADFVRVAGHPELALEERFASNAARVEHRGELIPIVAELLSREDLDTWLERLASANVPCGPINTIDRAFADAQTQARQSLVHAEHEFGRLPMVRNPARFSDSSLSFTKAPPRLGADTFETLTQELALDAGTLAALKLSGVIGTVS
jgi:crotonobetainyl-CoA:carnitine CoA-transferase CaiB-like acyl-CoA transferase